MSQPIVGQPIPSFKASSTHGEISSQALRGQRYILYFYPKDNTPGCSTQAQDFKTYIDHFAHQGVRVIGVSRDSLKSHANFQAKFELPFTLISDTDESLCTLFDVIKEKNMYGKQVKGIERSTFLINAHGVLTHEWRGVKVPGHVISVLEAVKSK